MAKQEFTFKDGGVNIIDKLYSAQSPKVNGSYSLFDSDVITNNNALPNVRVVIQYEEINPDFNQTGVFPTYFIDAELQSQTDNGDWYPIAWQFESFNRNSTGPVRVIDLRPTNVPGHGLDDIVFTANATQSRTSRDQGSAGGNLRLCVKVTEEDKDSANGSFNSVKITATGELSD